jgi:hypothetical protein
MCVQNAGIFDGPSDAASVAAMASWGVNAVRVPLNEDCWLGINGAPAAYSGAAYQTAIENYVALLHQYGMYAILELHWTAPGTNLATFQENLPDYTNSVPLWASVAAAFKGDPATIFDVFNEPNNIGMVSCAAGAPAACQTYINDASTGAHGGLGTANWWCWMQGTGCITNDNASGFGGDWEVASAQNLIDAIRGARANNVIMVGAEQFANDPSQWLAYAPTDPAGQLAMSFHVYNFNAVCVTVSCWNSELLPITAKYPIITGEIGESDGTANFIDTYMTWADSHGVSYLAWTWDTWGCGDAAVLISSYTGTACPGFGAGYQAHLASLAGSPTPTPTPTVTATPTPTSDPTPTPTATATASPTALPGSTSTAVLRAKSGSSPTPTVEVSSGTPPTGTPGPGSSPPARGYHRGAALTSTTGGTAGPTSGPNIATTLVGSPLGLALGSAGLLAIIVVILGLVVRHRLRWQLLPPWHQKGA